MPKAHFLLKALQVECSKLRQCFVLLTPVHRAAPVTFPRLDRGSLHQFARVLAWRAIRESMIGHDRENALVLGFRDG